MELPKINTQELKENFCTSIKLDKYNKKVMEIKIDSYLDLSYYKEAINRAIEILATVMDEDDYYKKDIDIIARLSSLNSKLCLDSELEGLDRIMQ